MLAPSYRDLVAEKYRSDDQAEHPHLYRDQFALYRGNLKYIEYSDGDYSLYDLASDGGEHRNVADQQVATTRALREALGSWRRGITPLPAGRPESRELTEEEVEELRALGYIQ